MHAPRHVLMPILEAGRNQDTAAAVQLTRLAFESGLLDSDVVPEILLALHLGDLRHLDSLAARSAVANPGGDARAA